MDASVASHTFNPFLSIDPEELAERLVAMMPHADPADAHGKRAAALMSFSQPENGHGAGGLPGSNPPAPNGENCGPLIDELNWDKYFVYCTGEVGSGAAVMARFLAQRLQGTRLVLRPVMSLPGWRELGTRGCFQPDGGGPAEWRFLHDVVRECPDGVFTFEYDLGAAGFGALDELSSTLVSTICDTQSSVARPLHVFVDALSDAFIGTGHLDRLLIAFGRIPSMRLFVYALAPFVTLSVSQFGHITRALAFRCEKDVALSQLRLAPRNANDVALVPGLGFGQFMSWTTTGKHPTTYYLGDDADRIE